MAEQRAGRVRARRTGEAVLRYAVLLSLITARERLGWAVRRP